MQGMQNKAENAMIAKITKSATNEKMHKVQRKKEMQRTQ